MKHLIENYRKNNYSGKDISYATGIPSTVISQIFKKNNVVNDDIYFYKRNKFIYFWNIDKIKSDVIINSLTENKYCMFKNKEEIMERLNYLCSNTLNNEDDKLKFQEKSQELKNKKLKDELEVLKEEFKNRKVFERSKTIYEFEELIEKNANEIKFEIKIQKKQKQKKIINEESKIVQDELKQIWFRETDTNYILHIGPTNSGKSFHAIEKLKSSKNGCYLAPLRLLAWEIAEKLNNEGIPCNLLTGEEQNDIGANFTSSTIEMFNTEISYECVVIDECLMLSDDNRGKFWLNAILNSKSKEIHLIANNESLQLIETILSTLNRKYKVNKYERLTPLIVSDEHFSFEETKDKTIYVVFSRASVLVYYNYFKSININCSILYGALPPEVRKNQMELFKNGTNTVCIATDAIGMGVNLPCDYIHFLELSKFDGKCLRRLKPMEVKQISGRAGRYKMSEGGTIIGNSKKDINFIKKSLECNEVLNKTYFGLTYNIFKSIPDKNVTKKLEFFKKMDCIPYELSNIIKKENMDNYIQLSLYQPLHLIKNLELIWNLLIAPVTKNNRDFWEECIFYIVSGEEEIIFDVNFKQNVSFSNLEEIESKISKIDLFLYMCNNKVLSEYVDDCNIDEIISKKENIILEIDNFLIENKGTKIKKCSVCKILMPIDSYYQMCSSCYRKQKISRYLNGDDDDDYGDYDDYFDWKY